MNIEISEVIRRKDLRAFIHLPAKIHKGHNNWLPPVYRDEWIYFNPKKNGVFSYCDTLLLIARRNGKPAGRIMGIINHKYNTVKQEKCARFCFLETYQDSETAHALLRAVEDWASAKGMNKLVGPLGFSDKDPQGLLVDGFDQPMVIATNCNFPYMVEFVKEYGFTKMLDLVVYRVPVPNELPEFYRKIYERALRNNPQLNLVNLRRRSDIRPFIIPALQLMNETFNDIYAFTPLTVGEMREFASRYMLILDPRFLKILTNQKNEVIAFILGIPDIADGIRKSKGYVLPWGIFQILNSQKTTTRLSLLLGAIREDYRNSGIDTILGVNMLTEAKKAGLTEIDSHLEMESHHKMRSEMEKMGGVIYKRYRIYEKNITR